MMTGRHALMFRVKMMFIIMYKLAKSQVLKGQNLRLEDKSILICVRYHLELLIVALILISATNRNMGSYIYIR